MKLTRLIPMLNISNIEQSLAFYNKALEFEIVSPAETVKEWRWATIRSGEVELMLSESRCESEPQKTIDPHSDTSWPTIFYFYPDDVDALYAHVRQMGYQPTKLEVTFFGMKEFSLQDPDGHLLSFGQDADERGS